MFSQLPLPGLGENRCCSYLNLLAQKREPSCPQGAGTQSPVDGLDGADAEEVSAELGLGALGEGGGISEGNHEASVGNVEWQPAVRYCC